MDIIIKHQDPLDRELFLLFIYFNSYLPRYSSVDSASTEKFWYIFDIFMILKLYEKKIMIRSSFLESYKKHFIKKRL